jgi:hypothetical protein
MALSVCVLSLLSCTQYATAEQSIVRSQDVQVSVNDLLMITSNRTSIQRVLVQGNLSFATFNAPAKYPADSFAISASHPSSYALKFLFDYPSDYAVRLSTQGSNSTALSGNSTYYVSGGSFELDVNLVFNQRPNAQSEMVSTASPGESFVGWLQKFGQAFPSWVKLVYLIFGVQFFTVGGLWIKRETAKKEVAAQHFDVGDKAFLWVDVTYKFLLASFLAIIAVMGGEIFFLFVLRFMFLVSFNLLSLWDLFVICFAAGAVIIAYLARFTLERAFDFKPIEDE